MTEKLNFQKRPNDRKKLKFQKRPNDRKVKFSKKDQMTEKC